MQQKKHTYEEMVFLLGETMTRASDSLVHNTYKPARVQARAILGQAVAIYADICKNTRDESLYADDVKWCCKANETLEATFDMYQDTIITGGRIIPVLPVIERY